MIYLAFMGGTEMLVNQFLKIQTSSEWYDSRPNCKLLSLIIGVFLTL